MKTYIPRDHTLRADLEFEDYRFPKGTGFFINEIAVGNECDEPEAFKPERWLDGHEQDASHGLWQFGGGRRICVGYRLAQRGLLINIARLVYCYDHSAVSSEPFHHYRYLTMVWLQASPIDPMILNHHRTDEPFPIKTSVRSERHRDLIIAEATKANVLSLAQQEA